jgi:hypothetical protein
LLPCKLCAKPRKRSKGSIRSIRSKGWGFRKVEAAFSYFLFLVSYSLFLCVFAPLRALRETKKVQKVGISISSNNFLNFEFSFFPSTFPK